jgi:hypothetical protein
LNDVKEEVNERKNDEKLRTWYIEAEMLLSSPAL